MIIIKEKLSHYRWRCIVRRERRRRIRQTRARERDKKLRQEQEALLSDPVYVAELEEYQRLDELAQKFEEEEAARRKEEWELRDAALHSKFVREKDKERLKEVARLKQETLIKKEWEEKEAKEKEEQEKKNEEQRVLLQAATGGLGKDGDECTHNPEPPAHYLGRMDRRGEQEHCPFFTKTGACRFGIHCSRYHDYPDVSETILIPNMYTHFGMEKVAHDEYDDDISLEYSERETYEHFRDFYEDVYSEFKRFGSVMQFKVCCNATNHLRGNLYIQYSCEQEAMNAFSVFNGRWYGGRQLSCVFVNISKWRSALCKLFQRNRRGCPKGGQCNFLHAFHNPGNAFWRADADLPPMGPLQSSTPASKRSSERRETHEGSRDRSRQTRDRSRRSRSRSRNSHNRSPKSNSIERDKQRRDVSSYRNKTHKSRISRSPTSPSGSNSRSLTSPSKSRSNNSSRRKRSRSKSISPSKSRRRSSSLSKKISERSSEKYREKSKDTDKIISDLPRHKSKSPNRLKLKSRSRSPNRSKYREKSRSPSRSKYTSRSKSPIKSKYKSRSPNRSKYKSRSRSPSSKESAKDQSKSPCNNNGSQSCEL